MHKSGAALPQLTAEMAEWITQGVAHQVGACTPHGRPCIGRGLAARCEDDGRLLVLVSGESAFEVLDAIRATARVAVNFTLPADFSSIHVKGVDAVVEPAGAPYRALLEARHAALHAQLAPLGFRIEYTNAWYSVPDEDLMAIRFTPIGAWNQTPGPGAGSALDLRR